MFVDILAWAKTSGAEKNKKEKQEEPPQILLLSSGELTPFTLELRAEHLSVYYRTQGNITGAIVSERLNAERI